MNYNKRLSRWVLPRDVTAVCTKPSVQRDMAMSPYAKGTPGRRDCWVKLVKTARRTVKAMDSERKALGPSPSSPRPEGFLPLSSHHWWLLLPAKISRGRAGWLENSDNQPDDPTGLTLKLQKRITEWSQNHAMNTRDGKHMPGRRSLQFVRRLILPVAFFVIKTKARVAHLESPSCHSGRE